MIVHSYFPDDVRVYREALSLSDIGIETDVVCLRGAGEKRYESLDHFRVHRLPVRRDRSRGAFGYLLEYLAFFLLASITASFLILRHEYKFIQVHNIPNILVLCGFLGKLRGIPLILDMHEIMPEFFLQRFGEKKNSIFGKFVLVEEKISVGMSNAVIVAGARLESILRGRGFGDKKIVVVTNAPDEALFRTGPKPVREKRSQFVLCYHGAVSPDYPLDTTIQAVAQLKSMGEKIFFKVVGDGVDRAKYERLAGDLDASDAVKFLGRVSHSEIPAHVAESDAGIVPVADDPYNDTGIPTKLYEYVILQKPVLVSEVAAVRDAFGESELLFFDVNRPGSIVEGILSILHDDGRAAMLVRNASKVFEKERWEVQKSKYHSLILELTKA